jgi:hypothetical protein
MSTLVGGFYPSGMYPPGIYPTGIYSRVSTTLKYNFNYPLTVHVYPRILTISSQRILTVETYKNVLICVTFLSVRTAVTGRTLNVLTFPKTKTCVTTQRILIANINPRNLTVVIDQ